MRAFLFDENIPLAIPLQLKAREPEAQLYQIGDGVAPPLGTPDPQILLWIEEHGCLLVTNNRASMPVHLVDHLTSGQHIPGIIQLPRRMSIRIVLENLQLISAASSPPDYRDQIVYLPL